MDKLDRRGDGKSYSFVMDNASIHKGSELRDLVAERGHRLVFIPPYSPEFNPIEMSFSAFKASLRRNYPIADKCTFQAMDYCIKEAITAEKCKAWFSHSGYRYIPANQSNTNGVLIQRRNQGRTIRQRHDPDFQFY